MNPKPRKAPTSILYDAFHIVLGLLIWPTAGYFFGLNMWNFYESYYSRSDGGSSANRW